MKLIQLNVVPIPKPRMTQSDRWRKRPAVVRYHEFKDKVKEQYAGTLSSEFEVTFWMPMPSSWSQKKKLAMLGEPHQGRPDIDNMLKALMDTLCTEDSHVFRVTMSKFWSDKGSIIITQEGE